MIPAGYVQALVARADRKGAAGIQELKDLSDSLVDRIGAGQGKEIVSLSGAGRTSAFQVNMTVEEQFSAVEEALGDLITTDGGNTPATYADFRNLDR